MKKNLAEIFFIHCKILSRFQSFVASQGSLVL